MDRIMELKAELFDNSREIQDLQAKQKSLVEELVKLEKEKEAAK